MRSQQGASSQVQGFLQKSKPRLSTHVIRRLASSSDEIRLLSVRKTRTSDYLHSVRLANYSSTVSEAWVLKHPTRYRAFSILTTWLATNPAQRAVQKRRRPNHSLGQKERFKHATISGAPKQMIVVVVAQAASVLNNRMDLTQMCESSADALIMSLPYRHLKKPQGTWRESHRRFLSHDDKNGFSI